jgi:ABC-2 type transport system permease protein
VNRVSLFDEVKRSWAITMKDVKIYYLRPPVLMFGILFPIALFFTFTVGRDISNDRLISLLAAQTVFWASSSIGPVAIPMERRIRTFERFLSAPLSLISVLWGKMMAGVIFGMGITLLAVTLGVFLSGILITNPIALLLGILLSTMAYSAMGILFASIPTGSPGEVIIPLNFFRIPLMFVSGMFVPIEHMPTAGIYAAFLSPLTHTLDLLRLSTGVQSFFGIAINIIVLSIWTLMFLYIGQMFHRIIMKRE